MNPLICLIVMIKDGKSVIEPTLRAAMPHMDQWFIFDTGSTDGTQSCIRHLMISEFPEKPGRIVEEPFVNFEVSRTRAIQLCGQECTFQIMLDDSYILHGGNELRQFLIEKRDTKAQDQGFHITIGNPTDSQVYPSLRIFRSDANVAYVGVVHEVPNCNANVIVPSPCYIEDRRTPETTKRSQQRFHRDLRLLLPQVLGKTGDYSRNVFYLAQTYKCLRNFKKAMEWYTVRVQLKPPNEGYVEEIYISFYLLGCIAEDELHLDWSVCQNYYLLAHGVCPERWECLYRLANYYYNHEKEILGGWNLCHAFAHMALENNPSCKPLPQSLFIDGTIYTYHMSNAYAMSAWYSRNGLGIHHEEARVFLLKCLAAQPKLESAQSQLAFFNERLKSLHTDFEYEYPAKVIQEIMIELKDDQNGVKQNGSLKGYPRSKSIVLTMTTCKRMDLFFKTINSFLTNTVDLDLISRWIIIDDNSTVNDRQIMKKLYPFFEMINKSAEEKGHAKSMNLLQAKVEKINCDFVFHLEDDWIFINQKPYLTLLMDILSCEPTCGQALVNRNYAERLNDDNLRIIGGIEKLTRHEVPYVVHEHFKGAEYENHMVTLKSNQVSQAWWPHYSLRPGLMRASVWKQLGPYDEKHAHFELDYATRYTNAGFRTCFLNGIHSLHIGKLTSEKETLVASAYTLNKTKRFT